ncbi:hypothetical protein F5148DRAFT_1237074, partial [Russula earlei]
MDPLWQALTNPFTKITRSLIQTPSMIEDSDYNYITDDKSDNGCKGGKKIFPLLLRISRPCHAIADPQKKMAWCITSKGC